MDTIERDGMITHLVTLTREADKILEKGLSGTKLNINPVWVGRLANLVEWMPKEQQKEFGCTAMSANLMRTSWVLHLTVWFVMKMRGLSRLQAWFFVMDNDKQNAFDKFYEGMAKHIKEGKDKFDPKSIGGMDHDEMIKTAKLCKFFLQKEAKRVSRLPA